VAQVQDLADVIGQIAALAAGRELKVRLRVEFETGQDGAAELAERMNKLLEGISGDLRLQ